MGFFEGLIRRYVKTHISEMDCMKALEMYCCREETFLNVASKTVHFMYDEMDLLSEEAILDWYHDTEDDDSPTSCTNEIISKRLKQKLKALIEWLNENSDEEDE